jgi:hypothetical protein
MAGLGCKNAHWNSAAFTLLNRYIDVSETIDGLPASQLDNSDFNDTDLLPIEEFEIPLQHYLSRTKQEEIREYIITTAMETNFVHDRLTQEWLSEVRTTTANKIGEMVRMHDKESVRFDDYLVSIRKRYFLS